MPTNRRGPKPNQPANELGEAIQNRISELGITRSELASRTGVSPATITRLINGETTFVNLPVERLCDALEFRGMNRRAFLKLVEITTATAFVLPTGVTTPTKRKFELIDAGQDIAQTLQHLLHEGGDLQYIMEISNKWYYKLLKTYPDTKDQRIVETQVELGLLLCNTQSLFLPFNQRANKVIQTCDSVQNDILSRFSLEQLPHRLVRQLAIVQSHRAPLHRAIGNLDESTQQYHEGIFLAKRAEDYPLLTTLQRYLAHNSAILGNERQWKQELEAARIVAEKLSTDYVEGALALLHYAEAEGYKRLAFTVQKELSRSERIKYVTRSQELFAQVCAEIERSFGSHNLFIQTTSTESYSKAHYLATKASEVQCFVLTDPEEALRRIDLIRNEVAVSYPSLLGKLDRTSRTAHRQLQNKKMNPLLLFGKDARPQNQK